MSLDNIVLSFVVAQTPERVIGLEGKLPWRLPSDLRRFREITTSIGTVVMGRKTYESIVVRNTKPLPDRHHIVLTRVRNLPHENSVEFTDSLEETFQIIKRRARPACIIGGEQIYTLFLPYVNIIYLTTVHVQIDGDTFFPTLGDEWKTIYSTEKTKWDERDAYESTFSIIERFSKKPS